MPNNKRNISFKKKNKRGGRGGSSIGVKVQSQIPGVYRASSKNGNKNTFYKISNNGHIVSEITNTDIKQIEQTINKEIKKKRAEQNKIKKAAKKILEIYRKHLNKPSEKFYREILDKFKKDITSHFKAIEILFETLGVSYNKDKYKNEDDYEVILADHKKEIKKKYIERYSNDQELRAKTGTKTDATELIKKINESIKKIENEHLANFRRKMKEEEQLLERKKKLEERKKRLEERKKRIEDLKNFFNNMFRSRQQQQRHVSEQAADDNGYSTDNMSINNSESNSNSESNNNNNESNSNSESNNKKHPTVKKVLEEKFNMTPLIRRPKKPLPIMKPPRSAAPNSPRRPRLLDVLEQNPTPTPKPNPWDTKPLPDIQPKKQQQPLPSIQPGQPKKQQEPIPSIQPGQPKIHTITVKERVNNINTKTKLIEIKKQLSNGQFFNNAEDQKFVENQLEIKINDKNYDPISLADKIDEQIKKLNGNFTENFTGGSRKPTKKQKRKGKLPKHLRNTRRRKSYHKKRQLKTKNTRTRKFKK